MQRTTKVATIADALIPRKGVWVNVVVDVLLIVGFAALTGLAARVAVYLNPAVPITGQTFAVLLTGATLGRKRGSASMLVYLVAGGLLGWPVFASSGAWSVASRGYLLGFLAAAAIVGYLCEKGLGQSILKVMAAMLAGEVAIYVFGLAWLAFYFEAFELVDFAAKGLLSSATRWAVIWEWGVRDFIIGDIIKLVMAAFGVNLAWAGIHKLKGENIQNSS